MSLKRNGDNEETKVLSETDALLLRPSPGSTNRPSLTNLVEYGSLFPPSGEDSDQALIQMSASSEGLRSLGDDAWPMKRRQKKQHRLVSASLPWLIFALVGIAATVWHFETHLNRGENVETETGPTSSNSVHQQHGYISRTLPPLSSKHPVTDLKVKPFERPTFSAPNPDLFPPSKQALPTNSWYQNLLLTRHEPTEEQRVYSIPYMIDVVGPIPGIRVHHPNLLGGANVIQLTQVLEHGLTLGAASRHSLSAGAEVSKKYKIAKMTKLGITLEWKEPADDNKNATQSIPPLTYSSSIVKGMPYATMQYNSNQRRSLLSTDPEDEEFLPTIASETPIGSPPILDGTTKLNCEKHSEPLLVEKEIQLTFAEPDYTWLVFVSRPVRVKCIVRRPSNKDVPAFVPGLPMPSPGIVFALQFLDDDSTASDLVIRAALVNDCTYGGNPTTCGRPLTLKEKMDPGAYTDLLRRHADLYPGPDTDVTFGFVDGSDDTVVSAGVNFNWNAQSMSRGQEGRQGVTHKDGAEEERNIDSEQDGAGLLMYALPHHQDLLDAMESSATTFPTYEGKKSTNKFCKESLLGPVCLVEGSMWGLQEEDSLVASFRAPRPPQNSALPALVSAYQKDLTYELPSYFQRGAGDTYFSGKMIAKLGRILTIGEELHEICNSGDANSVPKECNGLKIPGPGDEEFLSALARLRSSVEVWINGTADTPFIYDDAWGGMVSCGCDFDDKKGGCRNEYPDCPAFYDPGMDFGLSWFNDHHFHLGYHIYAAAVVAHFDPQWGRDHFEEVLLLIRDIANPSHDDIFFPTFRNKDWYQGSSWASGIAVSPLNGRNQESSSEAIAAYEGIALFGKEMLKAWRSHDKKNAEVAKEIQNYGGILMASELRSADRYWHVYESNRGQQYPSEYSPHVIGIMWNMMAQFQTWFGSAAYLAYGIQLLPLTAAAEKRDKIEWSRELYEPFKASCEAHSQDCEDQGWSVLVLAVSATVGHRDDALRKALELPKHVFTSAGGNGHSLTNTLWYLATRPHTDDPPAAIDGDDKSLEDQTEQLELVMQAQSEVDDDDSNGQPANAPPPVVIDSNFNCGCPDSCTAKTLNRNADGYSCSERIVWLMTQQDHSEWDACHQVGLEFPGRCGSCDPLECGAEKEEKEDDDDEEESEACPPCSKEVCGGQLNLCPLHSAPFLCTEGASIGGCSRFPWPLEDGVCSSCCKLSKGCAE